MGGAMILCSVQAQKIKIDPFYIGDRIPDLVLKKIINYKDTTTNLSSFGDKLIIFDFWSIHCGSCIKMFSKEDSLQRLLGENVQFILITTDKREDVENFLVRYNKDHRPIPFPIIVEDKLFNELFRLKYLSQFVWIAPNGLVLAHTSDYLITEGSIKQTLISIREREARLKGNKYADFNLHMQKPSKAFTILLNELNY